MRKLIRFVAGFIMIGILSIAALWCYALGPFDAPWFEFGFYGKFNQVQRIIRALPNIQIIDHWQHHDISMEDFGFEVLVAGEVREINFFEHSAQMQIKEDGEIRAFINECLFGTSLQNKLLPQSIFRQRNVDGIIRHTQNEKE